MLQTMLKVSIVMPVYNSERYLRECLDSVLEQTLKEIEVICIDDASEDSSLGILEEYKKRDSRVRVLAQESTQFAGVARNLGIGEAQGRYMVFWDADDLFEPDALEKMYSQCEEDEADICVCGGRVYDMAAQRLVSAGHYLDLGCLPPEVPFSPQKYPENAFRFTNPAPWNKMFRTEYIAREGIRFQDLPRSNDVYFVFMAIALAQRVTVVDRPLVNYRRGTAVSLQETNADSPFCFYEALVSLRQGLTEHKLFKKFEKGFASVALDMCIYNLNTQKSKNAWLQVALRLKDGIFKDLGVLRYPKKFFPNRANYEQMVFLLEKTPKDLAGYEPDLRKDERHATEPKAFDPSAAEGSVRVSVIIPIYNVERYIEECLRSVMRQSLQDIEIICIDDGSTDGSEAIVEQLQQEDGRIQLLSQANAGQSIARNKGLRVAQGEYVAFLDSDDLFAWCALEHLYCEAKSDNLDVLFFGGEAFYDPVELFRAYPQFLTNYRYKRSYESVSNGPELFLRLRENGDFRPGVVLQLFRRAFLEENQITFYPGIIHEDNLFTFRCFMSARRASVLSEPLYLRRLRPNSTMTSKADWKNVYGYLVCIYESCNDPIGLDAADADSIEAIMQYQAMLGQAAGGVLDSLSEEEIRAGIAALPIDEQTAITLTLSFIKVSGQFRSERKKANALQDKLGRLQRSNAFRLGYFLTSPWRLAKHALKSAKKALLS